MKLWLGQPWSGQRWFRARPQPRPNALGQLLGAGIAVVRGGQLLLIRRRDNHRWDIPGGGVNPGEEVLSAALRELTEETGVQALGVTLLGVFSGPTHQHTYPDGNTVDWVTVLYRATDCAGEPQAADDAAQVAWWPLTALPAEVSLATQAYFRAIAADIGVTPLE